LGTRKPYEKPKVSREKESFEKHVGSRNGEKTEEGGYQKKKTGRKGLQKMFYIGFLVGVTTY